MATSEPLVPNGLPYGGRQEVREGRQRAGLPNSPGGQGGQPQSGARMFNQGTRPGVRPARQDFDPLLEAAPGDVPAITQRQSQPGPAAGQRQNPSPPVVFAQLADVAGSGFARAVASRLLRR